MRMRGFLAAFAGVGLMASAGAAAAQLGPPPGQAALVPIANRSYVGFNPLGIPFDIFTAEIESGVAQGVTLGGLGSHIDVDDKRYTSIDFKFRYYPGEVVLRGFSLGASVGYLGYSAPSTLSNPGGVELRGKLNTPTIGVLADYNFLLGLHHRFVVGTGIGAKRVLSSSAERSAVDLPRAYFTGRFTVGLAF